MSQPEEAHSMDRLGDGIELKSRYPIDCPACGKHLEVGPSILMQLGINMGGAFCPDCGNRLDLTLTADGSAMMVAIREGETL